MSGFPHQGRRRIALIGAGMLGSNMAYLCSLKELGDVVLLDVVPNMPMGKGLDITQNGAVVDSSTFVCGANDYAKMEGAEVVIITAGITKIAGKSDQEWSRTDLLPINSKIMREVGENIKKFCPNAFVINITNPLDVMVRVLHEASGIPTNRICGMAGMLDSSRFRRFLADRLDVSPRDVQGMVLGVHGDNMVPLARYATVNGIPLSELVRLGWISEKDIEDIVQRTKIAGGEIVKLLGQGSAFFAPAAAAISMAESYLKDQKRVIVCSTWLKGEFGFNNLFLGVPSVIGASGVERVIDISLNDKEKASLTASVQEINDMMAILKNLPHGNIQETVHTTENNNSTASGHHKLIQGIKQKMHIKK